MTRPDENAQGNAPTPAFAEKSSEARYAKIRDQLPARASSLLPSFVADCGDADQAILQLETLLQLHPDEAATAFNSSDTALRACLALFGASRWLGQTLLQNPDLLQMFARPLGLVSASDAEHFREQFARFHMRFHETALPVLLARFKRREYVRIFIRELLALASVAEITADISALSDVLIEQALMHCESELRRRYQGWPQLRSDRGRVYPARFSVLSLGKLGGNELNYSSDIDLLYLYDDAEDAGAISISAREFFTRLAQELTAVLSEVSADGQVFRVDLRLRPQGTSGEMVVGCAQALRYYSGVAQDWELQALLKVRLSAGDRTLEHEFVSEVEQLIYCKPLNLSAVQTAAHSLERIRRGVVRRGVSELDVKNGAGGLREIEFVVQCLQRVHGCVEPWLRSSGTLPALQKLHDKGHIGDAEFRELCETYVLLRSIEHRLQCLQGAQSHRLPAGAGAQDSLLRSLGSRSIRSISELNRMMKSASDLCAQVLRLGVGGGAAAVTPDAVNLGSRGAERLMRELASRSDSLACALAADIGDPARRNLMRFLAAASTEEKRLRGTIDNVEWVERALPVFAQSTLATDILARHPEDIVALFKEYASGAENSVSDQLRIESRHAILRCVGRTLLEKLPQWEILRLHSQNYDLILQRALRAVEAPEGFAIFALGRLGTRELDAVSDADLVFLRSTECNAESAERCAHSLVAMLSGYTREGSVIAVDARLRPRGREGELVASSKQLVQYFETEAKGWETLAFGKLRFIAGTGSLAENAAGALQVLRNRFSNTPEFVPSLRKIRKRLEDSAGQESFKTGPGGLYDLDFLLGLLETRSSLPTAAKQLPERLEALVQRELLTQLQGKDLLHAADLFRRADHAVRVTEGRSRKWLPESDLLRSIVEKIVGVSDLDGILREQMRAVRLIFNSYFCD